MILTPEQIELIYAELPEGSWRPCCENIAETLVAYADIVERVAGIATARLYGHADWCVFCHRSLSPLPRGGFALESDHAPDCPYLAARKLRGKE